jgi:hypothetical protein
LTNRKLGLLMPATTSDNHDSNPSIRLAPLPEQSEFTDAGGDQPASGANPPSHPPDSHRPNQAAEIAEGICETATQTADPGPPPLLQDGSGRPAVSEASADGLAVSPASASLPVGVHTPEALLSPLEERLRRLEAAFAVLQAQPPTAVPIGKSSQRFTAEPPAAIPITATNQIAPASSLSPTTFSLLANLVPRPAGKKAGWLLLELLAEARVILRMYVDPRYRMTWVSRLVPPLLLLLFFFPGWLLPIVGILLNTVPLLANLVRLPIAFILFKVLGHEARRYRECTPDLPPSLRL